MKTLCVVIVVLSFTSVCQPASLACQKLLKPAETIPVLTGRWHGIAFSSELCVLPKLVNAVLWPSLALDVTAKDTANVYDVNIKMNSHGYCANQSETYFTRNNHIFDVDTNNLPVGDPHVMLQTGCPDCIVVKTSDAVQVIEFYSRRSTVTADEMREFETQTECLGWKRPEILKSAHDYDTCKIIDDDTDMDNPEITSIINERLEKAKEEIVSCVAEFIIYILVKFFEGIISG
ncbi:uncharacterized protein LOC128354912 [Scomber japonicus]|uniref:uncharacterized protein LOC128354912 n=1 Tax=Scomber japonicus TaxID=13676 RepID=UPI002305BB89|nr:uncharacterized protein LOC128354912 [Scomber japonicus]